MTLRSLKDEDFYFICLENLSSGARLKDVGILLCLREGAQTSDVIMGLLQACYIRKGLLLDTGGWESVLEARDLSDSVPREWLALMKESKNFAHADLDLVVDKMSGLGWACRNILLSTPEQVRYSFAADCLR